MAGFELTLYGRFWVSPKVPNFGSIAEFVGKKAVEDAAPRKSPRAGLSPCAWKSRKSGGIPTSSTASATTVNFRKLDSGTGGRKKAPTYLMLNLLIYSCNQLKQKRLSGDASQNARLSSSTFYPQILLRRPNFERHTDN
jgi:hypothetical protein